MGRRRASPTLLPPPAVAFRGSTDAVHSTCPALRPWSNTPFLSRRRRKVSTRAEPGCARTETSPQRLVKKLPGEYHIVNIFLETCVGVYTRSQLSTYLLRSTGFLYSLIVCLCNTLETFVFSPGILTPGRETKPCGLTRAPQGRYDIPAPPCHSALCATETRFIADLAATARHALQGRDDPRCSGMVSGHAGRRGLLHACVDASATAEGWKRGRGPSAFFGEIPIPPSSSPPRRRRPAASAPEPGPTKPRCAILRSMGPARRPGAVAQGLARGDGSRDRASGEAGMVGRGALRRERCL
jgi:hypothetical protein